MPVADMAVDCFDKPLAPHVPEDLVRPVNWFDGPGVDRDPFVIARWLRDEPPMVYTMQNPNLGQSWVPTRADLIRQVAGDPVLFSNGDQSGFAQLIGERWRLIPLELDGAEHAKFRKIISPWFSPSAMARINDRIEERARTLVDAFADSGECEFVSAFADPFPVSIFLDLIGLPQELGTTFVEWSNRLNHEADYDTRADSIRTIVDYLRGVIAERQGTVGDDLASRLINAEIDGQPLNDDDRIGALVLLFLGGLDTVATSLGYHIRHLAEDQALQARLRANPADIPKAVEELLRYYAPSVANRRVTADTELGGQVIKAGDWITLIWAVANLDPRENDQPDVVDLDRRINRHMTFAFGPHFCIGNHLARRELNAAYRELLTRLPPFRIADPETVTTHGGMVSGINQLGLVWDAR